MDTSYRSFFALYPYHFSIFFSDILFLNIFDEIVQSILHLTFSSGLNLWSLDVFGKFWVASYFNFSIFFVKSMFSAPIFHILTNLWNPFCTLGVSISTFCVHSYFSHLVTIIFIFSATTFIFAEIVQFNLHISFATGVNVFLLRNYHNHDVSFNISQAHSQFFSDVVCAAALGRWRPLSATFQAAVSRGSERRRRHVRPVLRVSGPRPWEHPRRQVPPVGSFVELLLER